MTYAARPDVREQRRHSRHQIAADGTLTYKGGEHACRVINASLGGVLIAAESQPPLDEELTLTMDHMGEICGTVMRRGADGSVIRFDPDEAKAMGINDMITFVLNKDLLDASET